MNKLSILALSALIVAGAQAHTAKPAKRTFCKVHGAETELTQLQKEYATVRAYRFDQANRKKCRHNAKKIARKLFDRMKKINKYQAKALRATTKASAKAQLVTAVLCKNCTK